MVWSPGSPKTCVTPSRTSWATSAWPPVIWVVLMGCIRYPIPPTDAVPAVTTGRTER